MDIEEILETIHRIRRELSCNYDDLYLSEEDREDACGYLKEALVVLGEER